MVTASFGTSKERSPKPSFTYTNTFAKLPPSETTVSAVFVPLQAGSWLISILAGAGAEPENLTVPLTVATVLGSMGVAGAAGALEVAAFSSEAFDDCSSFLLQAARNNSARRAKLKTTIQFFLFMT